MKQKKSHKTSKRTKIIVSLLLVVALVVPIAVLANNGEKGNEKNDLLGLSLGTSEGISLGDSDTSLGESSKDQAPEFTVVTDTVNMDDTNFTLEANVIVRNADGSRNRSIRIEEDDGFDVSIPGEYEITQSAISQGGYVYDFTYTLIVMDYKDFPFDGLPTELIKEEDLDRDNLPRWKQKINLDFIPRGWELVMRIDAKTDVHYWTLQEGSYDPLPSEALTEEEIETKKEEYRWKEKPDRDLIPLGWDIVEKQDPDTGLRYWTLKKMELEPYAASPGDITFTLSSAQQSFQTFTNLKNGTVPPQLTVSISVSLHKANIKNGQIVVDVKPANGYKGTPYFVFDRHDAITGDSIFSNVAYNPATGKATISIKNGILSDNSAESINIHFTYDKTNYDGAAPPKALLATITGEATAEGVKVHEVTTPLQVKSSSDGGGRNVTYEYFTPGPPAPVKIHDGQVIAVRTATHNSRAYQNRFAEPPVTRIFLPVGTEVIQTSTYTLIKGPGNAGVPLADGEVKGVPAGQYFVLQKIQPIEADQWQHHNYDGDIDRNFFQVDPRWIFPNQVDGTITNVYHTFTYKLLGESTNRFSVATGTYKTNNAAGWDLYAHGLQSTGSSTRVNCGIEDGAVSAAAVRSGWGYFHGTSQRNQGNVNVEGVKWILKQDTAKSGPNARINFNPARTQINATREKNATPFTNYKISYMIGNDKTNAPLYEKPGETFVPTASQPSKLLALPTLGDGEFISEIHIVPMGTTANPGEGIFSPGNEMNFTWSLKAWPGQKWPNGSTVPKKASVVATTYDMYYKDPTGVQKNDHAEQSLATYSVKTVHPVAKITTTDPKAQNAEPTDTITMTIQGQNLNMYAFRPLERPVIGVRLPSGIKMVNHGNVRLKDSTGADKGKVEVAVISESANASYYKLTTPAGYSLIPFNAIGFTIDFDVYLPPGIPAVPHGFRTLITEYDPDTVLSSATGYMNNALPAGDNITNYGFAMGDSYRYEGENFHVKINVNSKMKMASSSAIKSLASGDWSQDAIVAANFDEVVQMKLQIVNDGNIAQSGIKLYDIIPHPGYLNSSPTASTELVSVGLPAGVNAKTYYYHGAVATAPSLSDIQTINPATAPNWNQTKEGATAFFVDFGNTSVVGGKSLDVTLNFKTPGEAKGEQTIFNQFSFTTGTLSGGNVINVTTYESKVQGFTTESYSLRYHASPDTPGVVSGVPTNQSGVFGVGGADSITVSSAVPTREGYLFNGWNTKADGTGTAKVAGNVITFKKDHPNQYKQCDLYTQWKTDPSHVINITFDYNGGTGNIPAKKASPGLKTPAPTAAELNTLKYPGYKFSGKWYTTAAATGTPWDFDAPLGLNKNVKLYAGWDYDNTAKFKVTFNAPKGDPATQSKDVVFKEKVPQPTKPIRYGYKVTSWNQANGTPWNFATDTMPNKAMTLTAQWAVDSAQPATVTFDLAGGKVGTQTTLPSQSVLAEALVQNPGSPTKFGYTFGGWIIKGTSTTWNFASDKITETHVKNGLALQAKWNLKADKVTISFDLNNGTTSNTGSIAPQSLNFEQKVTKPTPDPTRAGYTFQGWRAQGATANWAFGDKFTETTFKNTTLVAQWEANPADKLTVTFDAKGGSPTPTAQQILAGTAIAEPTAPTKLGYTFKGWRRNGDTVNWNFSTLITEKHHAMAPFVLEAMWEVNQGKTVTASFNLNEGTWKGNASIPSQSLAMEKTVTKPSPDPEKPGYSFTGWTVGGVAFDFTKKMDASWFADFTIDANWAEDNAQFITVSFDLAGGTAGGSTAPQQIRVNKKVTRPTPNPTKNGYNFVAWHVGSVTGPVWDFDTLITHKNFTSFTLVAEWKEDRGIEHTITFAANGGKPAPAQQTVYINDKIIQPPAMTKAGYKFAGWYEESNFTGTPWDFDTKLNSTLFQSFTLYAKWEIDATQTITVDFDYNGGANSDGTTTWPPIAGLKVEDLITGGPVDPVRGGYTFTGWKNLGTGNPWDLATDKISTDYFKDFTLQAQWSLNPADKTTVHFDVAPVTPNPPNVQVSAESTVPLPSVTRTGYKIDKWQKIVGTTATDWATNQKVTSAEFPNMTLKAVWVIDSSQKTTVNFHLDGGTGTIPVQTHIVGEKVQKPTQTITKPGYMLTGWKDLATNAMWDFDTVFTDAYLPQTLDLEAVWTIDPTQKIHVTFDVKDANSGAIPAQEVNVEGYVTEPTPAPVKTGYRFDGWHYDSSAYAVDTPWNFGTQITHQNFNKFKTLKLYAKWSIDPAQTIAVDFDGNGGTGTVPTQTLHVEDYVAKPAKDPILPGYKVEKWEVAPGTPWNFATQITHRNFTDKTLKAIWALDRSQTITASFDLRGGNETIPSQKVPAESKITQPPTPTKLGYTFAGWYDLATNAPWDFDTVITSATFQDVYLYATWNVNPNVKFEVRFDPQKGSPTPAPQYLPVESLVVEPTEKMERFGWLFKGWAKDPKGLQMWDFAVDTVPANKDGITLYAQWYGDPTMSFTAYFLSHGGRPTPPPQSGPAGTLVQIPEEPMLKEHMFQGWHKDGDTESPWDFFEDVIEANPEGTFLHAHWSPDSGGGSNEIDQRPEAPDGNGPGGNGGGNGGNGGSGQGQGQGQGQGGNQNQNGKDYPTTNSGGSLSDLSEAALGFWKDTNSLMEHTADTEESWRIVYNMSKHPTKLSSSNERKTMAVPGPFLDMPTFILETLSGQKNRNLELEMGNYHWFLTPNDVQKNLEYETIPIGVFDSAYAPARQQLKKNIPTQQFRVGYTGEWASNPRLFVKITNEKLLGEQLYLYHYNEITDELEFVTEMVELDNDWYRVYLGETSTSESGEYLITTHVLEDSKAIILVNPDTGGYYDVKDLIELGHIHPAEDVVISSQSQTAPVWPWFLLALLPVAGIVTAIVVTKKKKKKEDTPE